MKKILIMLTIVSSLTMVGCKDTNTTEQSEIPQQETVQQEEFQEEGDWEVNDHSNDITYRIHWYTRQDITNAFLDINNNCSTCNYTQVVINYDVVTTYGVETKSVTVSNLNACGELMNAEVDCPPFGVLAINNVRIVSCY